DRREPIMRPPIADMALAAPCPSVYAPVARHVSHAVDDAVVWFSTCPPMVMNTCPDEGTVKVSRGHAAAVKSTHAPVVFSGGAAACVVWTGRAGIDGERRDAPAPESRRSSGVPVSRNGPWEAPSNARPPPAGITPPTAAVYCRRSTTA